MQLVHTMGALNWVRVAQLIGSRSPKQCRERYHQNLKPSLNHEPISPEEGLQIERLVAEMGKKWAEIARRLDGRSDNAVKNWWNGSMNRRRRMVVRRGAASPQHQQYRHDESEQQWSYQRQAPQLQPLMVPVGFDAHRRHIDRPLPSPAASEGSLDPTPSLVSDRGSISSISPRALPSPTVELPPLTNMDYISARRPSLPPLQCGSHPYPSDPRYHSEHHAPYAHMSEQVHHHQLPPARYPMGALPAPLSIPQIQFSQPASSPTSSERPQLGERRDSRMNLSALLA
jgi:Myb-like DNA-binding protein FlbD